VAACIACHGPAGRGNPLAAFPVVRGQHATYLVNTLNAYAAGDRRSDGSVNQMMRDIAISLRTEEIQAVSSYMQGLR
jgi:cytochrome c553